MNPALENFLHLSVRELKKRFFEGEQSLPEGLLDALAADPRCSAQNLARRLHEKHKRRCAEGHRVNYLLQFERELQAAGYAIIAGVDEAGMGPLAGPVVAASVILPRDYQLCGLDDSKKILHEVKRKALAAQIKADAISWSLGWATVEEIDNLNIYHAGLLAMQRAIENLQTKPDHILVDARRIPNCTIPQRGIIRGDQLSASIAAASIIAKTTRDAHFIELDRQYPGYGLAKHKGYSTPEHLRLLLERGALPIHRRSFRPVREALELVPVQENLFSE